MEKTHTSSFCPVTVPFDLNFYACALLFSYAVLVSGLKNLTAYSAIFSKKDQ